MERTAFEAPPRVRRAFATQEAGASSALRPQAEPGDECQTKKWAVGRMKLAVGSRQLAGRSGQWAVGSGQWAVGSWQLAV